MTQTSHLNWLITGASRGFGRALTAEALDRGDTVTATVRDATTLTDLLQAHGTRLTAIEADLLDPADRADVAELIRTGQIDVQVNNAGRAIVGAAEEVPATLLREQLELNFFAAAELTVAALPGMRARGHGTVIQMSSQGGRRSYPGVGAYSAGKFALEGWSEALAAEVAPFGIRVLLVEPSRFRTDFNTTHSLGSTDATPAYAETVGPVRETLTGADGRQEGDPARAARILADLAHGPTVPLRLPLGTEAVRTLTDAYTAGLDGVERWSAIACSADFPAAPSRPTARPAGHVTAVTG